ncbi:MAG: hypothetical protein ACKV0T_30410 [Planctomycetales bacterium]
MTESETRRFSIHLPRPLWLCLGTFVVVIVAGGIRFGMPVYRRQVAIREIERVGGIVATRNVGPVWLRSVVGEEWMQRFDDVVEVYLTDTQFTDAGLRHLEALSALRLLNLRGTQSSDAGLVHLEALSHLETLDLNSTNVTDAGLVHLKGLTRLQRLFVMGTQVTAEGVADLEAALPDLAIFR